MSRTQAVSLAVVATAAVVAWRLGGPVASTVGSGVLGGALLGTAVALLGHLLLKHQLHGNLEGVFRAMLIAFGAKLAFLLLGWATLSFVPSAARLADANAFALAFATAALAVLASGSLEHLRALHRAPAVRAPQPPVAAPSTGESHS